MKRSLLLFTFTHTKCLYLKKRISFLSNHGTHKWHKHKVSYKKIIQHFNGSSSVSSEKLQGREVLAMKNISLEYLHYVMFSKNTF